MNKQTKLILTVLGAAAILIPVVLLLTLSSKAPEVPPVSSEKRNIDTRNVSDVARRSAPRESPALPSPSPATGSAAVASPSPSPSPEVEEEP